MAGRIADCDNVAAAADAAGCGVGNRNGLVASGPQSDTEDANAVGEREGYAWRRLHPFDEYVADAAGGNVKRRETCQRLIRHGYRAAAFRDNSAAPVDGNVIDPAAGVYSLDLSAARIELVNHIAVEIAAIDVAALVDGNGAQVTQIDGPHQ